MVLASSLACQQLPDPVETPIPVDTVTAEIEPNDDFVNAMIVTLSSRDTASITGSIGRRPDVDVYDIGPVRAGDRVRIDAFGTADALSPSAAMYDQDGTFINEHTPETFAVDTAIDHTVREDTERYFLSISRGAGGDLAGGYEMSIVVDRGGQVPAPQTQVVLLNFAGGSVDNPIVGPLSFDPFDASDIDPAYQGQTDAIKAAIREVFVQNYQRFDVVILDTDTDETPATGTFTEVFFGGFSLLAFGVSEKVDLYNQDPADHAIVFSESFGPRLFGDTLSVEELGAAIGNVAAHEVGHALGLHHVRAPLALMDEASPAFTLLADQEFQRAPLSPLVFPLGQQDAAALLAVIVGPNPNAAAASRVSPASDSLSGSRPKTASESTRSAYVPRGGTIGKCLTCMSR